MSELCEKFEAIVKEFTSVKDGSQRINLQAVFDKAVEDGLYYNFDEADWAYIRQKGYVSAMEYSMALKRIRSKIPVAV